ncbi:hypothetical protein LUZ63_005927 [Rhynchospora breviuscula]|uniref:Saccharopine dehydrogenase NADP binding domain-containing protein n=1 Tax=Rhynchospora breviuscula TaxID=2022672 RepID=A0A9Q0CPD6_9POAL|nr:hypothetical protein LUZ63_005927 [Rhynchospora breviuscula]
MATETLASDPAYDLIILGASGFTGQYVLREALKFLSSPSSPSPLRSLAIAGRHPSKLKSTLQWAASPSQPPSIPILQADTSSPDSLLAIARQARLLVSCVGPFRLHGRPVVSACCEAGTDYLDISGEPEFMERMEAEFHEKAADTGALVVSACGFDSIPAEFGMMFHCRKWEPPSVVSRIEAYLSLESNRRIVGNMGTYESAVLGVANAGKLQEFRRSRPRRPRPKIVGPPPPKGPLIEHKKELGLWAVILPSADATVVRRTLTTINEHPHGLPGMDESPDFAETRKAFWSSIKPTYFGVKLGSKSIFGIFRAIVTGFFLGVFAKFALGRSLLLKFPSFFSAGWFRKKGPSEEEVRNATFKMWFVGQGYSDEKLASQPGKKPDKEIITRVSGPEIGYVTTPIALIQCALIVLGQRGNLLKGGVYTAGAVFGPTDLQKRLEENGISFDFISTRNR